jgi:hypothetical protein
MLRSNWARGVFRREGKIPEASDPKEKQMKKRLMISVVAVFLACVAAQAQEAKPAGDISKPEAVNMDKLSKKPISITGKVGSDGMTIVGDKDSKTWKVLNPDFLKENAGQMVRVSARVDKGNSEILVSSVMVQDAEPVVAKK